MSHLLFDHPGSNRRRPRRSTPSLESLEYRTMLATFTPLASAADGSQHSLRAAVIQADSNGQDNTIDLQAGMYQLTIPNTPGQDNGAARGDLDLTGVGHTITIQGTGMSATLIYGGKLDRVFKIDAGVTVIIRDLTILGGAAIDSGASGAILGTVGGAGGGLLNNGTTELDRVKFYSCIAAGVDGGSGTTGSPAGAPGQTAMGGAIYNTGTLTLNQCLVDSNFAEGGNGGAGAITSDPSAAGGPGGFAYGAGIYNAGALTVSQSTISNNQAPAGDGGHGGVNNAGFGPQGGQGGDVYGGGLYLASGSSTTIVDSTIYDNIATAGIGGDGGPGGNEGNPTVLPGDSGGSGGDSGAAKGGGIAAASPFAVYNSTIAENSADGNAGGQGGPGGNGVSQGPQGQPGNNGSAYGGGMFAPSDPGTPGLVTSVSNVIALNTSGLENVPGVGDLPNDVDATFASASNTLLQSATGAIGIYNGVAGDLVGIDPMLGPLQDNGGPTPTMALLPGSPAIDAGSNPMDLTADQRGYTPRVVGAAADIGAYEVGAEGEPITVKVKKVKGRREILVYDARTKILKFAIYPFGNSYRGGFQVTERDVNGDGVSDVIVKRSRGHHKFILVVYSGVDGSPLPANMA